jgi:hypothetical protein
MNSLLLALLLTQPVQPLQNLDTPLAKETPSVIEVIEGDRVPFDATCMTKPQALNVAKEVVRLSAENEEMKKTYVRPLLVVSAVVVALAGGIAAGYGIAQATRR